MAGLFPVSRKTRIKRRRKHFRCDQLAENINTVLSIGTFSVFDFLFLAGWLLEEKLHNVTVWSDVFLLTSFFGSRILRPWSYSANRRWDIWFIGLVSQHRPLKKISITDKLISNDISKTFTDPPVYLYPHIETMVRMYFFVLRLLDCNKSTNQSMSAS